MIFLDEPSAGVDVASRRALWDAIIALRDSDSSEGGGASDEGGASAGCVRRRRQCGLVLTTHVLEEAEALATRVGVMAKVWFWGGARSLSL